DHPEPADIEVHRDPRHAGLRNGGDSSRQSALGGGMGAPEACVRLQGSVPLAHGERDPAGHQRTGLRDGEGRDAPPVHARCIHLPSQPSRAPGQLRSHVCALQQRRCCVRHSLRGSERRGDLLRRGTEARSEAWPEAQGKKAIAGHLPPCCVGRRNRSNHASVACHALVAAWGRRKLEKRPASGTSRTSAVPPEAFILVAMRSDSSGGISASSAPCTNRTGAWTYSAMDRGDARLSFDWSSSSLDARDSTRSCQRASAKSTRSEKPERLPAYQCGKSVIG